jgi:hypothetical protein
MRKLLTQREDIDEGFPRLVVPLSFWRNVEEVEGPMWGQRETGPAPSGCVDVRMGYDELVST